MLFRVVLAVCTWNIVYSDIAAVYEHDILFIPKDNEGQTSERRETKLGVELPDRLSYPIALSHDPLSKKFFISDAYNPNTDIFQVSFGKKNISMKSVVPKSMPSTVDDVTYDPLNHQLFWTNSAKHGIFFANTASLDSTPRLLTKENVKKPRGITIDYCNRVLYWTERDESKPSIEMYDIESQVVKVLKSSSGDTYYQGIYYDEWSGDLIWAETTGDDEESSACKIVFRRTETSEETTFGPFPNCYPFSLTSDRDFVYWSDWSRHAIMRLSRESGTLDKLITTPPVKTKYGPHNGAFGLVSLEDRIVTECNKRKSGTPLTVKEESVTLTANKESGTRENANVDESSISRVKDSGNSMASLKDDSASHMVDLEDSETSMTKNSEESVTANEVLSLQSPSSDLELFPAASSSAASTFQTIMTPSRRLTIAVVVLIAACMLFVTALAVVIFKFLRQRKDLVAPKRFFASLAAQDEKLRKRKPHRIFGVKPKLPVEGELCPRAQGVQIEIEDCCQMTLCETPCANAKKSGRLSKFIFKNGSGQEDKKKLLEEMSCA